jgi:hypothetical protein
MKGAEKRVFSDKIESWIEDRVREYKDWWMEIVITELPVDRGTVTVARQLARKRERT